MVDIEIYRARIGLHYLTHCKVKGIDHFTSFELLVMLSIILLRCGDVHPNPGPPYTGSISSDEQDASISSISSLGNTSLKSELIKDKFSVIHYNVQSLQHKILSLESELSSFQILCFTETWLNHSVKDDNIQFSDYKSPFRRDREDDSHGGICVYVKENIFC